MMWWSPHHLFYENREQNNHSQLGMSLISFDIRSPHSSDDEHFDFNRLKIAPISKVSNENIRPPENQIVLIFMYSFKNKVSGCNLSPPRGFFRYLLSDGNLLREGYRLLIMSFPYKSITGL